ncbi:hypothetical protein BIY23_01695 [Wolbachia pipientis]|uniref:Uncharacterized protein n=1 Tax=Wolbachia pipientis TaxID=955 RepID=A0A1E7QL14_WOLPI|nr:hypothetical protein [Wolbachia pipientis]OEY87170.1 hypothetical protein BIY23_01695 [Wolbachia pipientis]
MYSLVKLLLKKLTIFSIVTFPYLCISEVINEACLSITTHLSGTDAEAFYAIFKDDYSSCAIKITCDKEKKMCEIITSFRGMGGIEAQKFMDSMGLEKDTEFFTSDKTFGIYCGTRTEKFTKIPFCNFYQRNALLLNPPTARPTIHKD